MDCRGDLTSAICWDGLLVGHLAKMGSQKMGIRIPEQIEKNEDADEDRRSLVCGVSPHFVTDVVGGLKSFPSLGRNDWTEHRRNVPGTEKLATLR